MAAVRGTRRGETVKVYIAAPYTKGDVVQNVRAAVLAAEAVVALGHTPWIPHLNMLWHAIAPHDPDFWYAYDLEFLPLCDALLRLPGESAGADREVAVARELGLPVFKDVADLPRGDR
jgi:hypothetical protein